MVSNVATGSKQAITAPKDLLRISIGFVEVSDTALSILETTR